MYLPENQWPRVGLSARHGVESRRGPGRDDGYRSELQVPFNSRLHLDMALCRADMHIWQCLRQPSPQAYFESLGRWMVR